MKKNKSFTIVELMIAMLIFILVIGGSIVLIQQTISAVTLAQSRLVAFNLAQEGIEITRNIRDNNWLKQRDDPFVSWDAGLEDGEREADYKSSALDSYLGRFLSFDNEGFYSYSAGTCSGANCTRFIRKITIKKDSVSVPEFLYITSNVQWNEKGNNHTVELAERLYDWYGDGN